NKADDEREENYNDDRHARCEHFVYASGGFHSPQIQESEKSGIEDSQSPIRRLRNNVLREFGANDGADERVEDVVHDHRPAGEITEAGVDFLPDVGVRRACARVDARHFAVADGSEEHGNKSDEDGGDNMAAGGVINDTVDAHGGDGLNKHQPNDD